VDVLQGMGTIQIHHGSAGSNMVARYLSSLHVPSVQEFFVGAQIAMDCDRHFGAIHDMSHFVNRVERLPGAGLDAEIKKAVLSGGLPTFGHPEISAAGRGGSIEQDPRPAIYLEPLFRAIDAGTLKLDDDRRRRLKVLQRIYQIAFVEGVVKPGRETEEPLRLTPNTDFGAWGVQEALGIPEMNRTFLTYVFRGFGWLMDAREQLQQKIVRPVIPPAPEIVPKPDGDDAIPKMIRDVHGRLATGDAFAPKR
jgi:citrate synthase